MWIFYEISSTKCSELSFHPLVGVIFLWSLWSPHICSKTQKNMYMCVCIYKAPKGLTKPLGLCKAPPISVGGRPKCARVYKVIGALQSPSKLPRICTRIRTHRRTYPSLSYPQHILDNSKFVYLFNISQSELQWNTGHGAQASTEWQVRRAVLPLSDRLSRFLMYP